MNASILRDFLIDRAPAEALAADLAAAWEQNSSNSRSLRMTDLTEDFCVDVTHLVRLCDAVEAGILAPEHLEAIGFGIIASDYFYWDTDSPVGRRLGETLYDWSCPEINYALTQGTIRKFRHRLLTGEDHFTKADLSSRQSHVRSRWSNTDGHQS